MGLLSILFLITNLFTHAQENTVDLKINIWLGTDGDIPLETVVINKAKITKLSDQRLGITMDPHHRWSFLHEAPLEEMKRLVDFQIEIPNTQLEFLMALQEGSLLTDRTYHPDRIHQFLEEAAIDPIGELRGKYLGPRPMPMVYQFQAIEINILLNDLIIPNPIAPKDVGIQANLLVTNSIADTARSEYATKTATLNFQRDLKIADRNDPELKEYIHQRQQLDNHHSFLEKMGWNQLLRFSKIITRKDETKRPSAEVISLRSSCHLVFPN